MANGSTLGHYQQELDQIIKELKNIEAGLRINFKNVGNEECADCVRSVINKFEVASSRLHSVSPSKIDLMIQAAREAKEALGK